MAEVRLAGVVAAGLRPRSPEEDVRVAVTVHVAGTGYGGARFRSGLDSKQGTSGRRYRDVARYRTPHQPDRTRLRAPGIVFRTADQDVAETIAIDVARACDARSCAVTCTRAEDAGIGVRQAHLPLPQTV